MNILGDNRQKRFIKEFPHWELGDEVFMKDNKRFPSIYKLRGWNEEEVFIEINENGKIHTQAEPLNEVDFNKSYKWRVRFDKCIKTMGTAPNFNRGNSKSDYSNSNSKIDMPPIELMTETECQMYLKKVLDIEDYITAKKITERLNNFFR